MMDTIKIISNNGDVIHWLRNLTDLPGHKFEAATEIAKTRTSKALALSYDSIDRLTYLDRSGYSDEETIILNNYYNELRKLKNSWLFSN